jgi:hypothetical protein
MNFFQKKSKWLKTHEGILNMLGNKEMQIKTTLTFSLTSVRMATMKNKSNNKF